MNEVIRAQPVPMASSYLSELIQTQPFNVLYLHSSLTTYDGIDTIGRSGIIARVPVEKTYGYICHWSPPIEEEWFEVGRVNFRKLPFSLRNARRAVVPLHGSHLSLHLIFG